MSRTVDMGPLVGVDGDVDDAAGEPAEPLASLRQLAGDVRVWRCDGGRWLGLTVGQAKPEFPLCLLVAVGWMLRHAHTLHFRTNYSARTAVGLRDLTSGCVMSAQRVRRLNASPSSR